MKFDLKRPCKTCPFRTDSLKGWLGKGRAKEILEGITAKDQTFTCHYTTEFHEETGEVIPHSNDQHCAGAMILLEKYNRPNQLMRIFERLGAYDKDALAMDAPVFDTYEEFVKHHSDK